jgi:hypothetical protein
MPVLHGKRAGSWLDGLPINGPATLALPGSCAEWRKDDKSKKVAVAELGGGSRLFLISPAASSKDAVPPALLGGELPTGDCLWGVVVRRLRAKSAGGDDPPAAAHGKRVAAEGPTQQPASKRRKRPDTSSAGIARSRTRKNVDKLPLSTTLITQELDLRALLTHRLGCLGATDRDGQEYDEADSGLLSLRNIAVGTHVEISWEVCTPELMMPPQTE